MDEHFIIPGYWGKNLQLCHPVQYEIIVDNIILFDLFDFYWYTTWILCKIFFTFENVPRCQPLIITLSITIIHRLNWKTLFNYIHAFYSCNIGDFIRVLNRNENILIGKLVFCMAKNKIKYLNGVIWPHGRCQRKKGRYKLAFHNRRGRW